MSRKYQEPVMTDHFRNSNLISASLILPFLCTLKFPPMQFLGKPKTFLERHFWLTLK